MDYASLYSDYGKSWLKVDGFRRRNYLYKHLLSLPYQWKKRCAEKKALDFVKGRTDFPALTEKGDPNLIVSLTTFPFRMPIAHLVVKSILMQTHLPGRIYLWLSEQEFPEGMDSLPAELKELTQYGLEICFVPGNLRAHKKYYYAFKNHPDKTVITVDDDCIYPPDLIEKLVAMNDAFPKAVCGSKVKQIKMEDGRILPFTKWNKIYSSPLVENYTYTPIGFGGVLYPAGTYDDMVLSTEQIGELAPLADDLWLKAMQIVRGVKVASNGIFVHPVVIPGSQKVRLMSENVGGNQNNVQWQKLDEHFGLSEILAGKEQTAG